MLKLLLTITLLFPFLIVADDSEQSHPEQFLEFYCAVHECEKGGQYGNPVPDEDVPTDAYYLLFDTDKAEVEDYVMEQE